ncbi:hypothetical protein PFISCL1PPCAC_6351, partial [Pristionchus fissidentatus]
SLPTLTLGWVNEDFPVIFKDLEGELTGIYVEMWKTWAKDEGYQLDFVKGDGYGGWTAGPNGWAGILGLIDNGTVNATLDKYSYRPGRYAAFRSSLPILYSKDTFFDSRSIKDGSMSINFVVFPILIIFLFVVSVIIVTLIERFLFILRLEIRKREKNSEELEEEDCLLLARLFLPQAFDNVILRSEIRSPDFLLVLSLCNVHHHQHISSRIQRKFEYYHFQTNIAN